MESITSILASSRRCFILNWVHTYVSRVLGCPSTCGTPPDKSGFPLDTLGVAGMFGGDEAMAAMAAIHVYGSRQWLGWYNSPGSYQIAKRLRLLSNSKFVNSFLPGVHTDPSTLFESDALKGPKFRAAHSGTIIEETSHAAALFMKECATRDGKVIEGRKTQTVGVTIAELNHVPGPRIYPQRINVYSPIFASIPVVVSIATCILCGVFDDQFSFTLILLGILTSGVSSLAIGSARPVFTHPEPPKGCPPGDGILGSNKEIVLLKGAEGSVNSVTRGSFCLSFSSERHYRSLDWCSHLLTTQFIAQLLLVPKCSPLGQVMFATSLAVSWIYNSWLSSSDKEKIQWDMLLNNVLDKPVLTKYCLGTRTTAVVFILLVLRPDEPGELLDGLLPNHTKVWRQWKKTVVQRLLRKEKLEFIDTDWYLDGFTQVERSLLKALYEDAQTAYGTYVGHAAQATAE